MTTLRAGSLADSIAKSDFFEIDTLPLSLKAVLLDRLSSGLVTDLRVLRNSVFHDEPRPQDLPTLSPVRTVPFRDGPGLALPKQTRPAS
jgi:hypothetical protein